MATVSRDYFTADPSPIDMVEDLAEMRRWDADRLGDDQIAMAVTGAWATYSVSLAWFDPDETLRMVATFDMSPRDEKQLELYKVIEAANDRIWLGGFNYWSDQKLMAFRYGLTLRGGAAATFEQVDALIRCAIENCERFYPAFHLVAREDAATEDAMSTALLEAAGQA